MLGAGISARTWGGVGIEPWESTVGEATHKTIKPF